MTVFPGCGHGHWRAAALLHGTGGTAVWSRSWWWRLWGIWGDAGAGTECTGLDFISKAHVIYRTHVSKLTLHLHTDSSSFWSSSGAPVDVQSLTNYFLPVVMPLWSWQWWPPMMQQHTVSCWWEGSLYPIPMSPHYCGSLMRVTWFLGRALPWLPVNPLSGGWLRGSASL